MKNYYNENKNEKSEQGRNNAIEQTKEPNEKTNTELYDLYLGLEQKVDKVNRTVTIILFLSVVIALISLVTCIISAIFGCGCKQDNDTTWFRIVTIVLGSISFIASVILAVIIYKNEVSKNRTK